MIDRFLQTAIHSVESSGKILTSYYGKLHDCRQKNQNLRDLVTEVDVLSEENIKRIIKTAFPDHDITGEESGEEKRGSKYCWHIDPLDGTVNYSRGIPLCAVSVGLEADNEIIVGAIFNPFTEELFFASKGHGAFFNGKKVEVSGKETIEDSLFVAAFSSGTSDAKKKEYEVFGEMNDSSRGVLRTGSAALSLAYLACGRIDGFWAKNLPSWDVAAGLVIVREAGGEVFSSQEKEYILGDSLLITSNNILKPLLQAKLYKLT